VNGRALVFAAIVATGCARIDATVAKILSHFPPRA
jgi:hypothetical protein